MRPLPYKKLTETAKEPTRAHDDDAGWDVYADNDEPITIHSVISQLNYEMHLQYVETHALIPTGLAVAVPPGCVLDVRPRSGLAYVNGVTVLNAPGTIDPPYRGELGVILINHGRDAVTIKRGDKIAQIVLLETVPTRPAEQELDDTDRGNKGFGSSGGLPE